MRGPAAVEVNERYRTRPHTGGRRGFQGGPEACIVAAMKVLFVTPPYHCGVVEVAGRWIPLQFVYLAGAARAAGFDCEIYDAMSLDVGHKEIERKLDEARAILAQEDPPPALSPSPTRPYAAMAYAAAKDTRHGPDVIKSLAQSGLMNPDLTWAADKLSLKLPRPKKR